MHKFSEWNKDNECVSTGIYCTSEYSAGLQNDHSQLCCLLNGDEQPTDKQPPKLLLGRLSKAT